MQKGEGKAGQVPMVLSTAVQPGNVALPTRGSSMAGLVPHA